MIQPLEILAQAINIICKNQDRCFWPRILHILEEICELTLCIYFQNDPEKVPLNYIQYLQLSHHAHLGLIPLLSVILVLFRETSKGIKTRINKRQLQAKLSFPYIVLLFKLKQLRNHGSISDFIQFSHSVVSDTLRPHELQHTRPPCHHQLPESTQPHVR